MTTAGRTLAAGPSLQWNLSEASGTSFADASGNAHTGSLTAGTITNAAETIDTTGDLGVKLTSGTASIQTAYTGPTAGAALTLLGWVHIDSIPASGANNLFGWASGGVAGGLFYLDSSGAIVWYDSTTGATADTDYGILSTGAGNMIFTAGSTHFLAATVDASNVLNIYLDGNPVPFDNIVGVTDNGIANTGSAPHRTACSPFACGASDFLTAPAVSLGIVAVFTRALSAAEIQKIWSETAPPHLHTVQGAALARASSW